MSPKNPSTHKKRAFISILVVCFVLTMLMTIVVSGISTLTAVGMKPGWHVLWLKAWLVSWAVAFPTILGVMPITRRLVAFFVEPPRV